MSNFKIGQKVVCIAPVEDLKKGEIYSIEMIKNCCCGLKMISVSEIKLTIYNGSLCPCGERYIGYSLFKSSRFRPLDTAFADEIEAMIKEQVKQEQLETV